MIKSYRGLMDDDTQVKIHLGTPNGKMGYKIIKFEIMAKEAGTTEYEHIVKIYKGEQSTVTGIVDFSDNQLVGAAYLEGNSGEHYSDQQTVVFDTEIFNQDIYITHADVKADPGKAANFYIELEQIKLSEQEALVSIVKNLRAQGTS